MYGSGFSLQERYMVVFADDKFELIVESDERRYDIPMTEMSYDRELMGEMKRAFDIACTVFNAQPKVLVQVFRRDEMNNRLLANAITNP